MAKYFLNPFGVDGDKSTIPETSPVDGSVSYDSGFGVDYQLDPGTDPAALNIPRDQFNELMYQITLAIQQYQQLGFPDFITTSDNGGTPFSYSKNATVRYSGVNYYSLVDSNTDTPPSSNWGVVTYAISELTGVTKEYYGSTLPSGYVWANGTTIGSASSGATGRANADTSDLFTLLWNSVPNSVLPIQDSSGAPTTRGISAAADYAADCRMPVPDKRGRLSAGKDDMGGITSAGRITSGGSGIAGSTLGASGGVETVQLTSNQNGQHTHAGSSLILNTAGDHVHGIWSGNTTNRNSDGINNNSIIIGGIVSTGSPTAFYDTFPVSGHSILSTAGNHTHSISGSVNNSGLGAAHQNVQPTIISNFIIKL